MVISRSIVFDSFRGAVFFCSVSVMLLMSNMHAQKARKTWISAYPHLCESCSEILGNVLTERLSDKCDKGRPSKSCRSGIPSDVHAATFRCHTSFDHRWQWEGTQDRAACDRPTNCEASTLFDWWKSLCSTCSRRQGFHISSMWLDLRRRRHFRSSLHVLRIRDTEGLPVRGIIFRRQHTCDPARTH